MSVVMDSSPFHQPGDLLRVHHNDSLHPLRHRGAAGVQKRSAVQRHRSISTSQVERLHQYALDNANPTTISSPSVTSQWITPDPSPQPPPLFADPVAIEPFAQWAVPTPPRSDSVTFDSTDIPVTAGVTATGFDHFGQPTTAGEMSSLEFLLPSQYGSGTLDSEPSSYGMDQTYIPPVRISQPPTSSGPPMYTQASSSPALYQSKSVSLPGSNSRRESEYSHTSNADSSYAHNYRKSSGHSYEALSSADYPPVSSPSKPTTSSSHVPQHSIASHSGAGVAPQHPTANASRSPSLYDSTMYAQQFTTAPSTAPPYTTTHSSTYLPPFVGSSVNEVLAKPLASDSSLRLSNQRPKPQCWEHGCNGRQFSTFSNLLRHQREKSGTATKSYCPKCGAEFTRTTARNGHLLHDKCTKQRQPSDDRS